MMLHCNHTSAVNNMWMLQNLKGVTLRSGQNYPGF